jgi:hypothetical protein
VCKSSFLCPGWPFCLFFCWEKREMRKFMIVV